jgi:hypothetical protein
VNHFFNTIGLRGDELHNAILTARNQEEAVLAIMSNGKLWSPSEVWKAGDRVGKRWLLTSVRRAMTTLEEEMVLEKTDTTIPGPYGKPEHCWRKA